MDGQLAGYPVGRIGFGAMQLEPRDGENRAGLIAVLRRAAALGVNHFDTAAFYAGGAVNSLLNEALAPFPPGMMIATKVGASWVNGRLAPAQRPTELRAEVEANLRSLGVDQLDVVNLRRIDSPPGLVAKGEQVVNIDDQLAELMALRDAGVIAAIGLSNVSVEQLDAATGAGIVCVQNGYNLLDRDSWPVLRACAARGIAFVPFFPLGSGFPGRARVTDDHRVRTAAARLNATPAQIGLAWLLAQYDQLLLIPGTRNADHVRENVAAGNLLLDRETIDTLN